MKNKKISIVIPCYNEGSKIVHNLEGRIIPFLKEKEINYEIIPVNDGSKDNTKEVFKTIKIANVLPIGYDKNRGKGGAVKFGIEHATGDYIVYMDADLSTHLSAFDHLLNEKEDIDFFVGSRHLKDSVLTKKQGLMRRFIGRSCRIVVNTTFRFRYKDTQCGFKAIKTNLAKEMAKRQIINGFAFDVEYLYMAKLNNLKMKEFPVIWENDEDSKVSALRSSVIFFKDVFKIKRNKRHYYFDKDK